MPVACLCRPAEIDVESLVIEALGAKADPAAVAAVAAAKLKASGLLAVPGALPAVPSKLSSDAAVPSVLSKTVRASTESIGTFVSKGSAMMARKGYKV